MLKSLSNIPFTDDVCGGWWWLVVTEVVVVSSLPAGETKTDSKLGRLGGPQSDFGRTGVGGSPATSHPLRPEELSSLRPLRLTEKY